MLSSRFRFFAKSACAVLTLSALGIACASRAPENEGQTTSADVFTPGVHVLTQRGNAQRTGAYPAPGLSQQTVQSSWGLVATLPVDGTIFAQPLYVGGTPNTLYVATGTNHVYAFNADTLEKIWDVNLGQYDMADSRGILAQLPLAGGNPVRIHDDGTIDKGLGILSTPVIDLTTRSLYVSYRTEVAVTNGFVPVQHVVALSLANGARTSDHMIQASEVDGNIAGLRQRASLLLSNGIVYVAFAGHVEDGEVFNMAKDKACALVGGDCPEQPFHFRGQVLAFDAKTLAKVGSFHVLPTDKVGGGIWQASTGLAADSDGNIYFSTGNMMSTGGSASVVGAALSPDCVPDGNPNATHACRALANSVVKLHPQITRNADGSVSTFSFPTRGVNPAGVDDFFMPYRAVWQSWNDMDLASAGVLVLPGTNDIVAGGKEGILYVLDHNNLGGYDHHAWTYPEFLSDMKLSNFCGRNSAMTMIADVPAYDTKIQKFQAAGNYWCNAPPMDSWLEWPHIHGTPTYANFGNGNSFLYVWPEKDALKAFRQGADGKFDGDHPARSTTNCDANVRQCAPQGGMPGGMVSIAVDSDAPGLGVIFASVPLVAGGLPAGVLHAYDPIPNNNALKELWTDGDGPSYVFAKQVPPTIGGGRVFMATWSNAVNVYGHRPLQPGVAVARENVNQITMLTAGEDGAVYVGWEANNTPWHPPVRITNPHFVDVTASFAMQYESTQYGRLDGLFVGIDGKVYASSVDNGQPWTAPQALSPAGFAPSGAPIATGWQWIGSAGGTLDAFVIDNTGRLNVLWKPPGDVWHGPAPISQPCRPRTGQARCFTPGARIATGRQNGHILDVFAVDDSGALDIAWLPDFVAGWTGPDPISNPSFAPPGAGVATGHQGANTLDVFVVDSFGRLNVDWLVADGPRWGLPAVIAWPNGAGFPPGANIATAPQGTNQLDVFIVDYHGATTVSWLVGEGAAGWQGPAEMPGVNLAPAGAPIAADHQSDAVLDVLVSSYGGIVGRYAVDGGGWLGPYKGF